MDKLNMKGQNLSQVFRHAFVYTGNHYWSTLDFLVPTSLDQLLFMLQTLQNNLAYWGGQLYLTFPFSKGSLVFIIDYTHNYKNHRDPREGKHALTRKCMN
jgi:hypothetical protein